jgi:hypothetical protein
VDAAEANEQALAKTKARGSSLAPVSNTQVCNVNFTFPAFFTIFCFCFVIFEKMYTFSALRSQERSLQDWQPGMN